MTDPIGAIAMSVMAACVVYALIVTIRGIDNMTAILEDVMSVLFSKDELSKSNAELAKTVNELAEKNDELYGQVLLSRGVVRSVAPRIIQDTPDIPDVGKEKDNAEQS